MKKQYTFVSLGYLETLGFRLGGAGLGNILFPWARAVVYANKNSCTRIQTTWFSLKLGPILRNENDKRFYSDLFTGYDGISGFQKFCLVNFSDKVKFFKGIDGLFKEIIGKHNFIKRELLQIVNPSHISAKRSYRGNGIAVHIRMGDFISSESERELREGKWNYRIPIRWYVSIIEKIRTISNLPVYIFSDANDNELNEILCLDNCNRVFFGSAISDLLALSESKLLITSASTFSMWASFLGQMPTIWFPGQHKQDIIFNSDVFEGELDYSDLIPDKLINFLQHD